MNRNINYCYSCNYCSDCDSCGNCNYCSDCENCNYCDYCSDCYSCDFCDFCYFCKNLKMTEYNVFCYSTELNSSTSFQQKRYRAFNKEIRKDRYHEILALVRYIIPNPKNFNLNHFWESVTQKQWKQLLEIPEAKDFKEGFEFISGVKIEDDTLKVQQNGKT